jgi:uncharacterized membrane protein YraQ (UPF0718 family)
MIILLHVTIALLSIAHTTVTFFIPSKRKLQIANGLVAATLASGTYLVISTHAAMLQACSAGLIYLSGVSLGLFLAHRKLALQTQKIDS